MTVSADQFTSPRYLSDADVLGLNERPASPPDRKIFVANYAGPKCKYYIMSLVNDAVNSPCSGYSERNRHHLLYVRAGDGTSGGFVGRPGELRTRRQFDAEAMLFRAEHTYKFWTGRQSGGGRGTRLTQMASHNVEPDEAILPKHVLIRRL